MIDKFPAATSCFVQISGNSPVKPLDIDIYEHIPLLTRHELGLLMLKAGEKIDLVNFPFLEKHIKREIKFYVDSYQFSVLANAAISDTLFIKVDKNTLYLAILAVQSKNGLKT